MLQVDHDCYRCAIIVSSAQQLSQMRHNRRKYVTKTADGSKFICFVITLGTLARLPPNTTLYWYVYLATELGFLRHHMEPDGRKFQVFWTSGEIQYLPSTKRLGYKARHFSIKCKENYKKKRAICEKIRINHFM